MSVKSGGLSFGNSPSEGTAFAIAFDSGNSFGGAVSFTPQENLNLSNVTLWLSGYTSQIGLIPSVSIYNGMQFPYAPSNEPAAEIASFSTPPPNNGSSAPFTFTNLGSSVLEANQEYWLFVYGFWDGTNLAGGCCYWEEGGAPTGSATYDGAEYFVDGGFFSSSTTPAFVINAVSSAPKVSLINGVFTTNGFGFQVAGSGGAASVVILASTNMVDWTPISTNAATGDPVVILDSDRTNLSGRFYKAELQF